MVVPVNIPGEKTSNQLAEYFFIVGVSDTQVVSAGSAHCQSGDYLSAAPLAATSSAPKVASPTAKDALDPNEANVLDHIQTVIEHFGQDRDAARSSLIQADGEENKASIPPQSRARNRSESVSAAAILFPDGNRPPITKSLSDGIPELITETFKPPFLTASKSTPGQTMTKQDLENLRNSEDGENNVSEVREKYTASKASGIDSSVESAQIAKMSQSDAPKEEAQRLQINDVTNEQGPNVPKPHYTTIEAAKVTARKPKDTEEDHEKGSGHFLETKFIPSVLSRYPPADPAQEAKGKKTPFPEYISMFCFPKEIQLIHQTRPPPSTYHSFAMTDEQGNKSYAVCVIAYEKASDLVNKTIVDANNHYIKTHMTQDQIEYASHLSERMTEELQLIASLKTIIRDIPDEMNILERQNALTGIKESEEKLALYRELFKEVEWAAFDPSDPAHTIWVPKCLGVVSSMPWFDVLSDWCRIAVHETLGPENRRGDFIARKVLLESAVVNLIEEIPIPPPGKYEISMTVAQQTLYLSRPAINQVRSLKNFSLYPYFRCLSHHNIVVILEAILAEGKIIFLSKHTQMLTLAAESSLILAYPFYWPFVYIPVLPDRLMTCLQAPVPYIVGVQGNMASLDQPPDDAVIVDLDQNKIFAVEQPLALPDRQRSKLLITLDEVAPLHYSHHKVPFGPPPSVQYSFPNDRLPLFSTLSQRNTSVPITRRESTSSGSDEDKAGGNLSSGLKRTASTPTKPSPSLTPTTNNARPHYPKSTLAPQPLRIQMPPKAAGHDMFGPFGSSPGVTPLYNLSPLSPVGGPMRAGSLATSIVDYFSGTGSSSTKDVPAAVIGASQPNTTTTTSQPPLLSTIRETEAATPNTLAKDSSESIADSGVGSSVVGGDTASDSSGLLAPTARRISNMGNTIMHPNIPTFHVDTPKGGRYDKENDKSDQKRSSLAVALNLPDLKLGSHGDSKHQEGHSSGLSLSGFGIGHKDSKSPPPRSSNHSRNITPSPASMSFTSFGGLTALRTPEAFMPLGTPDRARSPNQRCARVEGHYLVQASGDDMQLGARNCFCNTPEPRGTNERFRCIDCGLVAHEGCLRNIFHPCLPTAFDEHAVQEAFLGCFSSLLWNYRQAMTTDSGDASGGDFLQSSVAYIGRAMYFSKERFLKTADRDTRPYLATLVNSQAFTQFITERLRRSPRDSEILFFDEIIKLKLNQSKLKFVKEETPFLEDTSYRVEQTFWALPPFSLDQPLPYDDKLPDRLDEAKLNEMLEKSNKQRPIFADKRTSR